MSDYKDKNLEFVILLTLIIFSSVLVLGSLVGILIYSIKNNVGAELTCKCSKVNTTINTDHYNRSEIIYKTLRDIHNNGGLKDVYTCKECNKSYYSKDLLHADSFQFNNKVFTNIYFIYYYNLCRLCWGETEFPNDSTYQEYKRISIIIENER